jgi:hypothetical protein
MNDLDVLAYVKAASSLLALPLEEARAHAVAEQLGRTLVLARQLDAFPLPPEVEMSEIFCPAAFPSVEEESGFA